jgi:hypothetical protein
MRALRHEPWDLRGQCSGSAARMLKEVALESTAGRYCATLVAIDVATSWTELQALWDLHHRRVTGWKFSVSMRHFFSPILG